MIKKFAIISVLFFSMVSPVLAAGYGVEETTNAANTGGTEVLPKTIKGESGVAQVIGVVIESLLGLMGLIFFVLMFYAGFEWMTAKGNMDKVDNARETITETAIGLILIFGAYAITNFVFSNLK